MLFRSDEVTKEELQAADGLILGSPAYFANIAGAMKAVIDEWNWKMKVDFTDKVGGAFATGGGQTGGKEHVVVSLLLFMINNRMVVAGPLYQNEAGTDIWGEIGYRDDRPAGPRRRCRRSRRGAAPRRPDCPRRQAHEDQVNAAVRCPPQAAGARLSGASPTGL